MKFEARVTSLVGGEKLKAYVSLLIDDCFLIKGIKMLLPTMELHKIFIDE